MRITKETDGAKTVREKKESDQAAQAQDVVDNLPSWGAISDAVDSAFTGAQKTVIKKLARTLYLHVKGTSD